MSNQILALNFPPRILQPTSLDQHSGCYKLYWKECVCVCVCLCLRNVVALAFIPHSSETDCPHICFQPLAPVPELYSINSRHLFFVIHVSFPPSHLHNLLLSLCLALQAVSKFFVYLLFLITSARDLMSRWGPY